MATLAENFLADLEDLSEEEEEELPHEEPDNNADVRSALGHGLCIGSGNVLFF